MDPTDLITLDLTDVPRDLYDEYCVARVRAVSEALAVLCDCGVPEGLSESSDPRDRAVLLPHHFDCSAAEAVPAVERAVRTRAARALASAAQAWETEPHPLHHFSHIAGWLRDRAVSIEAGQVTV